MTPNGARRVITTIIGTLLAHVLPAAPLAKPSACVQNIPEKVIVGSIGAPIGSLGHGRKQALQPAKFSAGSRRSRRTARLSAPADTLTDVSQPAYSVLCYNI